MSYGVCVVLMLGLTMLSAVVPALEVPRTPRAQLGPSFDYSESDGCLDIKVFSINKAKTEVLMVQVDLDPKSPPSTSRPLIINLANSPAAAQVRVHTYRTEVHDWPCSDVSYGFSEEPTTWHAIRGTLTVIAEKPKVVGAEYKVTVRITGGEFSNAAGATIRPRGMLEIKTLAGQMVGG